MKYIKHSLKNLLNIPKKYIDREGIGVVKQRNRQRDERKEKARLLSIEKNSFDKRVFQVPSKKHEFLQTAKDEYLSSQYLAKSLETKTTSAIFRASSTVANCRTFSHSIDIFGHFSFPRFRT